MVTRLRLSRDQLASFLRDHEQIKQFENLFAVAEDAVPSSRTIGTSGGIEGGGDLSADRNLSLTDTGVTAGDYGDASNFVTLTVDAKGRITAIQEFPAGSASISTATIDFGAFPGSNEASVAFIDAAILAGSNVRAWFAADSSTADHTDLDHRYAPLFIGLTALPTAGVGGTIYARSEHKMQGQWSVKYSWS